MNAEFWWGRQKVVLFCPISTTLWAESPSIFLSRKIEGDCSQGKLAHIWFKVHILCSSYLSSLLCKFCLHLNEQWSGQPKEKKKHSQIINISFSSCIILESKLKFHLKIICLSTTCSLVRRTTCFQPGQLSNLYWLLRENNGMPEGQRSTAAHTAGVHTKWAVDLLPTDWVE